MHCYCSRIACWPTWHWEVVPYVEMLKRANFNWVQNFCFTVMQVSSLHMFCYSTLWNVYMCSGKYLVRSSNLCVNDDGVIIHFYWVSESANRIVMKSVHLRAQRFFLFQPLPCQNVVVIHRLCYVAAGEYDLVICSFRRHFQSLLKLNHQNH